MKKFSRKYHPLYTALEIALHPRVMPILPFREISPIEYYKPLLQYYVHKSWRMTPDESGRTHTFGINVSY